MIDRFGPLPEAARTLLRATELKLKAVALGIRKIDAGPRGARLRFKPEPSVDPTALVRLVQGDPVAYRLDGEALRMTADLPDVDTRLAAIGRVLDALTLRAAA